MTAINASRLYADRFVHHALQKKVTPEDVRAAHAAYLDLVAALPASEVRALEMIRAIRRAVGGPDTATRHKQQDHLDQLELDL